MQVPRTHMAVGRVGRYLVVAGGNEYNRQKGGYDHTTIRGVVEVLDLEAPEKGWQSRSPIPGVPRGWIASSVIGDAFYVLGGLTFEKTENTGRTRRLQQSWRYDPAKDRWTQIASPPVPISGWEAAPYDNRYIICVGGVMAVKSQETIWNDIPLVYDTKDDRWLQLTGSPTPPAATLNDPGVCIHGNQIYVAGAEGPKGSHFDHFLIGTIKP